MRSNLRAESDIQMDILLRENETPGEGERPLPDNSHTFLKKGKVGKMKQRKRKPKGAAVREKESRARAAESSQTAREGGAFQLSYQRGE